MEAPGRQIGRLAPAQPQKILRLPETTICKQNCDQTDFIIWTIRFFLTIGDESQTQERLSQFWAAGAGFPREMPTMHGLQVAFLLPWGCF